MNAVAERKIPMRELVEKLEEDDEDEEKEEKEKDGEE